MAPVFFGPVYYASRPSESEYFKLQTLRGKLASPNFISAFEPEHTRFKTDGGRWPEGLLQGKWAMAVVLVVMM
jgi:hypothetical protein